MRMNKVAAMAVVLVTGCVLAGCQGQSTGSGSARDASTATPTTTASASPSVSPSPSQTAEPTDTPKPTPTETTPTAKPKPKETAKPKPRAVMGMEDRSKQVRELEARLVQLELLPKKWVDGYFGTTTRTAVRTFQRDKDLQVLGYVDAQTWSKLQAVTREPTRAELYPPIPKNSNTPGALDPRCETGRVICLDKTSRTLRWVVDGQVRMTLDVRFGCASTPTRMGTFSVYSKQRHGYSRIYDTRMPFSMFFSGGQAVHYSDDFNARGYNGCSHGCANIRSWSGIEQLFGQVRVGDKVVVYRS
jgi:L,D-transpeptidase catalytic domain/Putative peptidoglycan binding domain